MPTLGNTPRPAYVYDTETDTWVPVGVGAHTHSDIPNTLVDAKGDLITATEDNVPARLAKGADGTILVSDSTTSTGLAWQPYGAPFVAGKNKIINGDFNINQRAFSSQVIPLDAIFYGADRWNCQADAATGTVTYSIQQFTTGTAPVSGYEAKQYARVVTTGQTSTTTYSMLAQFIENVRTLAGQTSTISFWAKANTGTPKVAVEIQQKFGSGGSPSAQVRTYLGQVTLSTAWQRYTVTANIPSISGKTMGTTENTSTLIVNLWVSCGSSYNSLSGSLGIQSNTFDFWGVQVEAGPIATPFTTATGTIQGELAACQRYYWRAGGDVTYEEISTSAVAEGSGVLFFIKNPVTMRSAPSSVEWSTLMSYDGVGITAINSGSLSPFSTKNMSRFNATPASAPTSYRPYTLFTNNSANGYIAFNAEL